MKKEFTITTYEVWFYDLKEDEFVSKKFETFDFGEAVALRNKSNEMTKSLKRDDLYTYRIIKQVRTTDLVNCL